MYYVRPERSMRLFSQEPAIRFILEPAVILLLILLLYVSLYITMAGFGHFYPFIICMQK